jgi:hypothetical protein
VSSLSRKPVGSSPGGALRRECGGRTAYSGAIWQIVGRLDAMCSVCRTSKRLQVCTVGQERDVMQRYLNSADAKCYMTKSRDGRSNRCAAGGGFQPRNRDHLGMLAFPFHTLPHRHAVRNSILSRSRAVNLRRLGGRIDTVFNRLPLPEAPQVWRAMTDAYRAASVSIPCNSARQSTTMRAQPRWSREDRERGRVRLP